MQYRMKTSKKTMNILLELKERTKVTPNYIARIAICLSLRDPSQIENDPNTAGLEFNRHTLTGDYDRIFKALIAQHCNRELTDEEYFPIFINRHLERGANLLNEIYKYEGNFENFIKELANISETGGGQW